MRFWFPSTRPDRGQAGAYPSPCYMVRRNRRVRHPLDDRSAGRVFTPTPGCLWLSLFVFWAVVSLCLGHKVRNRPIPRCRNSCFYCSCILLLFPPRHADGIGHDCLAGGLRGFCCRVHQSISVSQGQYFVPPDAPQIETGRAALSAGGFATEPDALGATLILPFSLAAGILLSSRTWLNRLFMIGCVGLIGTCIYASMSRGAVIAIAVVVLIYLWRSRARPRVWVLFLLMGGSMAAMPGLFRLAFPG